ncbi:MAG: response regulator transcription factor [Clostridia bacterium]|nr:response regulator transcription factor [Clostridia bacterium]
MLCIAICDDDPQDRSRLRRLLLNCLEARSEPAPRLVEYSGGVNLLSDLEGGFESFDFIFLDIFMGAFSGMDTARRIRARGLSTPLIFLTTTAEFAIESYDVAASGYLLKPPQGEKLSVLLARLLASPPRPRVCLSCGRERRYFFCDEISYAESDNHNVLLHLTDGSAVSFKEKLNTVEQALADPRFLRCHQSYLVNMDQIVDVNGDFYLRGGAAVPIRVRSHREITARYYQYFISHAISSLPREVAARG